MNSIAELNAENADLDLATLLDAWNAATGRLQRTHEVLREEVKRLTDELEVENRELARKNRLADLGQMASHVAHEVRNSLVPMTLYLSLLQRQMSGDGKAEELCEKFSAGFTALESTVEDLLQFTGDRGPVLRTINLHHLMRDIVESLAPQFRAQGVETIVDVDCELQLQADENMVRRATLNLVLNALDAMPHGGCLSITAKIVNDAVAVCVTDTGTGIAVDAVKRVFEPFYSSREGGTGLGLAIVERVTNSHGGSAAAANRAEGGAMFTMIFPYDMNEKAA